ncbi:hypothetical protein P1X15_04185 [Runella sp. MFBS21]|uniref:hypothetical protein n=1 Tax=Runella sp. MFBS21 TaxID=3034018 RepID=UPI0023F7A85D|nr:hypothetical protein [Runella sp. MFBS21]MDF7816777.1 hypothetical protein [Runella sp. MFBS21]
MSIIISTLALLATFYQLYLQRVHNEKSLKPLAQIDVVDHRNRIYIYLRNNGMGPMIIDRLTFIKEEKQYTKLEDCLELDRRSYLSIAASDTLKRVVLPNAHLIVFETQFEDHEGEAEKDNVRKQLAPISLKAECRDIYDNKFTTERNLQWFSRYDRRLD